MKFCLESGQNPYDARRKCDPQEDGPLCYKQMGWIENWLNDPKIKAELGVDSSLKFQSCNLAINQAFMMQGDSMHFTPALLPDMINDGIRLLIYAGDAGSLRIIFDPPVTILISSFF
jgi:cathepsin A (carboxypeptidase C)